MTERYLPNLVNKSKESPECLRVARELFKRWFCIKLEGPFENENETNIARDIFNQPMVDMTIFPDILYMLENFGDLINYIEVDFKDISAADGKEIVQRINDHCSALVSLKLNNCHGNVLDDLTGEFPTISNVFFSSHRSEELSIKPDNKRFRELFPNLFFLHIGNVKTLNEWTYIGGTYEKVPHINLHDELNENDEVHFIEFLQQNPQLMGLSIHFANRRLLSKLNGILADLKFLYIEGLSTVYPNHGLVHIGGLKQFSFTAKSRDEIPDGIDLHDIKELSLDIPFSFNKKWIGFLKNLANTTLNKLRLKTKSLKKIQLLTIAQTLPNLQEVNIEVESNINVNDIEEILKSFENDNLERFTLGAGLTEANAIELGQLLEEWDVNYENKNGKTQIIFDKLI